MHLEADLSRESETYDSIDWFPVSQGSLSFAAKFPSVLKTVVLYILVLCLKTVISYKNRVCFQLFQIGG